MFDLALLDIPLYAPWPRFTVRRFLLAGAWLLCLATAWQRFQHGVREFDRDDRPPSKFWGRGNGGHAHIDFGGQWLMGRMIATGRGRHLYDRNRHWKVLREGYPASGDPERARAFPAGERPPGAVSTDPKEEDYRTDVENLMTWTMGSEREPKRRDEAVEGIALALAGGVDGNAFSATVHLRLAGDAVNAHLIAELDEPTVGGPLYPPVHALLYAPLGLIADAQSAYFVLQALSILACFAAGGAAQSFSRGRLAWPVCTTFILLFPGFRPGLDLGQNHAISLAVLLVGWALVVRGREFAGGAVWGLLAFKPVWGLAFVLVPLLMLRWRVVLAMGAVGCGLALATLPIVGVESWSRWLQIGGEASATYNVNRNWIDLSRDLSGIPKRILLDFDKPEEERADPVAERIAWAIWGTVFASTVAIYWLRADRRRLTGLGAGFLFLGAYHCCYRFMYYDVLLATAGVFVMFSNPGLFFRTPNFKLLPSEPGPFERRARLHFASIPLLLLALLLWNENVLMNLRPRATLGADHAALDLSGSPTAIDGKVPPRRPTISVISDYYHPVDTVLLLVLWSWAGWRLIRSGDYPRSASSAAPMSGARISDSPTSTA